MHSQSPLFRQRVDEMGKGRTASQREICTFAEMAFRHCLMRQSVKVSRQKGAQTGRGNKNAGCEVCAAPSKKSPNPSGRTMPEQQRVAKGKQAPWLYAFPRRAKSSAWLSKMPVDGDKSAARQFNGGSNVVAASRPSITRSVTPLRRPVLAIPTRSFIWVSVVSATIPGRCTCAN